MTPRKRVKKSGRVASLRAAAEGKRLQNAPPGVGSLYRPIKQAVTLRLDADVLAWFKKPGRGYQTRINRTLRAVMMGAGKSGE